MTRVGHSACLVWTIGEAAGGSKIQCAHCAVTKCAAGKFSYLITPWPWISDSQPKVNNTPATSTVHGRTIPLCQQWHPCSKPRTGCSKLMLPELKRLQYAPEEPTHVILSRLHEFHTVTMTLFQVKPKLTTALFKQKPRLTNCWKTMFFSISQVL